MMLDQKTDYKKKYLLLSKQYVRDTDDCIEALQMAKELINADLIGAPQPYNREEVLERINKVDVLDT